MICADFKNLGNTINTLERAGLDTLHFDFCDGKFAPTFLFSPTILKSIRHLTGLRFDAHMYCEYPSIYLEELKQSGVDLVIIQVESKEDYREVILKIIKKGMKAGIGILPGTKIPKNIQKVFNNISIIMINTVGPVYSGQSLDNRGIKNLHEISNLVKKYNYEIDVGVDGNVNINSLEQIFKAGANFLVCGTTSVFNKNSSPSKELKKLYKYIAEYSNLLL